MWLGLLILAGILVTGVFIFMNAAPQFGSGLTREQAVNYEKLANFSNGKFLNNEEVDMNMTLEKIGKMIRAVSQSDPNARPKSDIPTQDFMEDPQAENDSTTRITWLGHSTLFIEMEGKKLLIDPVFSQRTSPVSFMGAKRFYQNLPLEISELPTLDAVIISHDHYDHLDYETIRKLDSKTERFYVPLGVDNHLRKWNVKEDKIVMANWWDEFDWQGLKMIFIPSRHFSGRGINDRFTTLWGGWIFAGAHKKIFYSGDGGYGSHFKEIGDKYGPFDIGLMECGQYNENWSDVHMMPEETVQAAIDVKTNLILAVHWGAFPLAPHAWTDPIERITRKANELNLTVVTPMIGGSFILGDKDLPNSEWWKVENWDKQIIPTLSPSVGISDDQ